MKTQVLTPAIGVEVYGLDLAAGLNAGQIESLRALWLKHLVLVVKDQHISPGQQLSFAQAIGEPDRYPFLKGLDQYPQITEVLKKEDETINFGGLWHADTTYQAVPPMATMLYALELPRSGGDTLFANQYAAYETLSAGLRQSLASLRAVSSAANKAVAATRVPRISEQGTGVEAATLQATHPMVRRHPESGRNSLFINPAHTVRIDGWSEAESAPLLKYLFDWQTREELSCRLRWEAGDLVLWDNRCTLHYPINDYSGQRRLMHRITLKGDPVVGGE